MAGQDGDLSDFTISLKDFDQSLLPADARTPGTDAFQKAVSDYFVEEFREFGGWVQIAVDTQTIHVRWQLDPDAPDPVLSLVQRLNRGDVEEPVRLLEKLCKYQPGNVVILHSLGMALSDMGQLDRAEIYLRQGLALEPEDCPLWTALGVALVRQGRVEEAIAALREAVAIDANDLYAQRNLGGCLIKAGAYQEGEEHLRRAVEINPKDQQSVFGLAQALQAQGKMKDADTFYARAIDLDATSTVADAAKTERRNLAERSFRAAASGLRADAVMYCADAIRRFQKMPSADVQRITYEVAVMGQRGLSTNDPASQYRLKSLPGDYSGLQLVCMMYVGFQMVAPEHDIGFDLSKEYQVARAMCDGNQQGE